ncbi:Neurochondrin, partial [Thalictrum thalictroides]
FGENLFCSSTVEHLNFPFVVHLHRTVEQSAGMEECLKLLKGERDEQRLAGLLLATKFCKGDDHASIQRVYEAVGTRFLDRLLKTGMGVVGVVESSDRDAYLQLSVTVLAAISRVPEIACSKDIVSKIPYILDILKKGSGPSIVDECYEFLFLVATTSEDGLAAFYESGGMNILSSHMSSVPDGSHPLELAMRLLQSMLSKLPLDSLYNAYPYELSLMVATIARQFALLHNALKFEALSLLSTLLSSKYAAPLHDALRSMSNEIWSAYLRVGIGAILQNRVASTEKLQALILADILMSILGEKWLIDQTTLPGERDCLPADRCLLLVLESSRIEVAVLLNELAYLKYEATNTSAEDILLKRRNLSIAFSLIEKIIKLISNVSEDKGSYIDERTIMKVISGLNETIGVVLNFLQDAKEHGQRKGDDLLASVRVVGSYLAESPFSCKEKIQELLEDILLIQGEDEPSPFYSVCFMLPMLCQITMDIEGCRMLVSNNGLNSIADCLVKLIDLNSLSVAEDYGTIFLACDTVMNVLLKKEKIAVQLDASKVVHLLIAFANWTDSISDSSVIMMASTICTLLLDSTSEKALLNHPDFKLNTLSSLARLVTRSLTTYGKDSMSESAESNRDLHDIITAGYTRWADRFPYIKEAVKAEYGG